MKSKIKTRICVGIILLVYSLDAGISIAQIEYDNSLNQSNSNISRIKKGTDTFITIPQGRRRGAFELHSFKSFNLDEHDTLQFDVNAKTRNLVVRVTGEEASNIRGRIELLTKKQFSDANFLFFNPKGIKLNRFSSFNLNESFLSSKGSFLFSTADSIFIKNQMLFTQESESKLTARNQDLLTLSFNKASLTHPSLHKIQVNDSEIKIQPSKTLAFIGDGLSVSNSRLATYQGHIELSSLAEDTEVTINTKTPQWQFNYISADKDRRGIEIQNSSIVATEAKSSSSSGIINLIGENINISMRSLLRVYGEENSSGFIKIDASELLQLHNSRVNQIASFRGRLSPITILAKNLNFKDSSVMSEPFGTSPGGIIIFDIKNHARLTGLKTTISASTAGTNSTAGGQVRFNAQHLILKEGAQIQSNSRATSKSGSIIINLNKGSLRISGLGKDDDSERPSGINAISTNTSSSSAGNVQIFAEDIKILDSGKISIEAQNTSAGSLLIEADTLTLNKGEILATTNGRNGSGEIILKIRSMLLLKDSQVSANSQTSNSPAGDINVHTRLINADNSIISSNTKGGRGNINITGYKDEKVELLQLQNNSKIETNSGNSVGGNIDIKSFLLLGQGNSDITANSDNSKGGEVKIMSQISPIRFNIDPDSLGEGNDITAASSDNLDLNGIVEVESQVNPSLKLTRKIPQRIEESNLYLKNCITSSRDNISRSSFTSGSKQKQRQSLSLRTLDSNNITQNWFDLKDIQSIADNTHSFTILNSHIREASYWKKSLNGSINLETSNPSINLQQDTIASCS